MKRIKHIISQYTNLSTYALFSLLSLFMLMGTAHSQTASDTATFKQGLKLYQKAEFKEAAKIFSLINTPRSTLFTGKSYFSAGNYLQAQRYLSKIDKSVSDSIFLEGLYTQAITAFQLHQFEKSIQLLHKLTENIDNEKGLKQKAENLYADIINYLTINQRKQVFMSTAIPQLRLDIIESLIGRVDYPTLNMMVKQFKSFLPDTNQSPLQYDRIKTALSDSVVYSSKYNPDHFNYTAPEGISYDIGVALPLFQPRKPEFKVTRGLYNGILLAAEKYNQQHPDRKVFIRFHSTTADSVNAESIFNKLVWKQPIDAMIGPLYSESAYKMANLAELYHIPMLTPLANSDTLNLDNPYVFQMNPTFSVRGRKMARHAVNNLGLDTMAVIAQEGALGYESAFAFRDKAERLGAKVAYFLVEDFAAKAYDLSDYTKYFTADKKMRDSLNIQKVDAIYAPFTGKASHTLIDLLMTDLEAANADVTLLGSAEWGTFEMGDKRRSKFDIYYPEADPLSADSTQYGQFDRAYETRFGLPPTKFSYVGYDAATLLMETLDQVGNPARLSQALKRKEFFKGLTGPIEFRGRHINQEIEIKKILQPSK